MGVRLPSSDAVSRSSATDNLPHVLPAPVAVGLLIGVRPRTEVFNLGCAFASGADVAETIESLAVKHTFVSADKMQQHNVVETLCYRERRKEGETHSTFRHCPPASALGEAKRCLHLRNVQSRIWPKRCHLALFLAQEPVLLPQGVELAPVGTDRLQMMAVGARPLQQPVAQGMCIYIICSHTVDS